MQKAIEALGCPFATTFMEKCVIDESHPQFAGMYAGAASDPKTRQIVEGADLVLDLGGVNLNDITTSAYSAKLDRSRFITVGLNDVRIGDDVIAGVRLADVLAELAKLKPASAPYRGTPQGLAPVNGKPSDKITMDALYPRYAAFLRAGDTIVLETGSTSPGITPMILPDGVRVEAQVLWGSIGWATPAAFGVALADPDRRTVLITGDGSHQLTANDIGAMGRFGANVIVFVLNNSGYLIERALEENPNWTYNDLAPWNYARTAEGARMRGLVYGAGDHAWRARRSDEGRACQQIRGVYRDHRRQDGHAAGSCLRARPAEGNVRRHAIISSNDTTDGESRCALAIAAPYVFWHIASGAAADSRKFIEPERNEGRFAFARRQLTRQHETQIA